MSHASEHDTNQLLRELEKETTARKGDVDAMQRLMGLLMPNETRKVFDSARQRVLEILPGSEYESWDDLRGERSIAELLDVVDRGLAHVMPRLSRLAVGYLCAYGGDVRVQPRGGSDTGSELAEEVGEHAREEGKRDPADSQLEQPVNRIDADQLLRKLREETAVRKADVGALKQIIGLLMPDDMRKVFDVARERVLEILPGSEYETWNELCGDRSTTELLDFIERGLVNARQRPSREVLRYLCACGGDVRVQVHMNDDNISELAARGELEQLAQGKGQAAEGIDTGQVQRELAKEIAERKGDVDALQQVIGILIPPHLRITLDCGRRRILEEVSGYPSWRALRGGRSVNELVDVIDQGLVDRNGTTPFRPSRDALQNFCAYGGDVQHERGRLQQERRDNYFTGSYDEEQCILSELDLFVLEEIHWMVQQTRQSGQPV